MDEIKDEGSLRIQSKHGRITVPSSLISSTSIVFSIQNSPIDKGLNEFQIDGLDSRRIIYMESLVNEK
jgi:hypothetical protein